MTSVTTIENEDEKQLNNRQREFARYYVEGLYSNAECARKAGYSPASSRAMASKLLNGSYAPHVVEYIQELRQERERRYGVTVIGQLKRLDELSRGAEDSGQFSAAINAEKIRSALGGLTVDRREQIHQLDDMTKEDIALRLSELRKQYPQAFIEGTYTEKTDAREKLLVSSKEEPTTEILSDTD